MATFLTDFKTFIMRGNVVDLAVGVIIGGAFGGVVTSVVNDLLMPPIGRLTGGHDFSNHFLALDGNAYNTLAEAKAHTAVIAYGNFANALVNFVIIAFAIFLLVKAVSKLYPKPPAPPPPGPTPEVKILTEIRDLLAAPKV